MAKLKNMQCYWCGAQATSKEHVPPKSFFEESKRNNLITVPACTQHNEDFTKIDEAMRFYLQGSSDHEDAVAQFKDKTMRSIHKPEAANFRNKVLGTFKEVQTPVGELGQVTVDAKEHSAFIEKIARGLFCHIVKMPSNGMSCVFGHRQRMHSKNTFITEGHNNHAFFDKMLPVFDGYPFDLGKNLFPEVFEYRCIDLTAKHPTMKSLLINFILYRNLEVIAILSSGIDAPILRAR